MGRRVYNPRRIKIHRSYTVEEAARALGVGKGAIRRLLKDGLGALDDARPTMIPGLTFREFLEARRAKAKQTCPPGYLFCVRCRAPKPPAFEMADYIPLAATSGNLRGICPDCGCLIHRRVGLAKIEAIRGNLKIRFPEAHSHISESALPSVNDNLKGKS
jgi:hypothetical protein